MLNDLMKRDDLLLHVMYLTIIYDTTRHGIDNKIIIIANKLTNNI